MRVVRSPFFALAVLLLTASTASAQNDNLAGMIKRLFDGSTINAITPNPANPAVDIDHRPHFILGDILSEIPAQFNVALASQLASFPVGSSSGGFSYNVNERGEVVPTSTTFGPAFAERGLTLGEGKFNFGYSFQATSYDSFENVDLDSGQLRFIRQHNDCCPAGANNPTQFTDLNPAFERDLLQSDLVTKIDTRTTAFFASVGVTNRLDVGIAVPIVHIDMEATVNSRILRLGSGETAITHSFPGGTSPTLVLSDRGSATGIGDILLRGKYNFYRSGSTALAAALELRLPTGNEDELLGTGATGTRMLFVGSGEYGRFSPHVNIGYTLSSGDASAEAASIDLAAGDYGTVPGASQSTVDLSVPDEFNYTAGFNMAIVPRVTVGFDVLGRYLRGVTRFDLENITYPNRGTGTLPTTSFTSQNEVAIASRPGNLNFVLGVIGGKINIGPKFILNATVLFALTDGGLKPKPTPVIGFDYVF
jgi:hypothetical protein